MESLMEVSMLDSTSFAGTNNLSILSSSNAVSESLPLSFREHEVAELSRRLSFAERDLERYRIESERQLNQLRASKMGSDSRAANYEAQLADTLSRSNKICLNAEQELRMLREAKKAAEDERLKLTQLNADLSLDLDRKRNELATMKMQLTVADDKATKLANSSEQMRNESRTVQGKYCMAKRQLLEALKMKPRIEALEAENDRLRQESDTRSALSTQLRKLGELERENARLIAELAAHSQSRESAAVMREEIVSLGATVARQNQELAKLRGCDVENSFLKEKLKAFSGVDGSIQSAADLAARASELEATSKADAEELAGLKEALAVVKDSRKRLADNLTAAEKRLEELQKEVSDISDALTVAKSNLTFAVNERDSYKMMAHIVESSGLATLPMRGGMQLQPKCLPSLQELDTKFQAHANEVDRIRADSSRLRQRVDLLAAENRLLKEKLDSGINSTADRINQDYGALKAENVVLKDFLEAATGRNAIEVINQCDEAEKPIVAMVLHFRQNPFKMAKEQAGATIDNITSGTTGSDSAVAMSVDGCSNSNADSMDELKKRLDALEVALQRKEKEIRSSRETAAGVIQDMRTAVMQLCGYDLTITADKDYSLRSVYWDAPGDMASSLFLFRRRPHRSGTTTAAAASKAGAFPFKLLETAAVSRFEDSFKTYVVQHNSIPAFLASVTMELLSKQTLLSV